MGIFIACVDDGCESHDLLHLVLEVTGEKKKDKEAKVATARTLWVPAVNHHGGFGRWDFLEIEDPWNVKNLIRRHIAMNQMNRIQKTPGVCGGSARIRETRIPVWTLIRFLQLQMPAEQILANYPTLSSTDLQAAREYYKRYRSEIDLDIEKNREDDMDGAIVCE